MQPSSSSLINFSEHSSSIGRDIGMDYRRMSKLLPLIKGQAKNILPRLPLNEKTSVTAPGCDALWVKLTEESHNTHVLPVSRRAIQMISVKKSLTRCKVPFCIVSLYLKYAPRWLKDTLFKRKHVRFGLAVARWAFSVYIILPGCIWLV